MAAQRPMTEFLLNFSRKQTESSDSAASEPPEKRKLMSPDRENRMGQRSFRDEWCSKFSWLRYDDSANTMFCDICCQTGQENPMVTGCSNFKTTTLTRHQDSNAHSRALEKLQMQKHFKKAVKNVEDINLNLFKTDKLTRQHMVQLRTVYVMSQKGIPANDFEDLMELQKANGCENADIFYTKPEIVCEMETVLSDQIEKTLITDIKDSPFFGVMLDETCDITIEKKLVIYVRYIKDSKVRVAFPGNKHITNGTAEGIKTALCDFLVEKGIIENNNYGKLMGLGTDGAAVMTGCRNGVGMKLKQLNDKMVQVHCVAHRLNLAASQASNEIKYMEDYRRYIQTLHRYYSDSEVRYTQLKELQQLLHGKTQQVPEGTTVRWLSVESAVKMIYKHFDSIVMSLDNDKDKTGKAAGLWTVFTTSLFLLISALLIDILTTVGILSLTFQKDHVNLSSIRTNVDSTVSAINDMRNGSNTVNEVLQTLGQVPGNGQRTNYKGVSIQDNNNLRARFLSVRAQYIDNLLQNLSIRFPDDELDLLHSFDIIFNPKRYPQPGLTLSTYGQDNLDSLCEHYDNLLDVNRCKGQFLQFKHFVASYRNVKGFEEFVEFLIEDYRDIYPDFVILASAAIIIPVSSAPCERGFSHQNVLKNKLRNRLNPERLNRLMMIRLAGPSHERLNDQDLLSAARAFGEMKARQK